MIPEKVLAETQTRFEHNQPNITTILNEVQLGNSRLKLDDPERVIARLERLGASQTQARAILNGEPISAIKDLDETARVGIERLLGKNDLISASFLSRGLRAAKAVVRVEIGGGQLRQPAGYGTGFLISDRVLLTNNHVLESLEIAGISQVRFEYEESADNDLNPGVAFALEPERLFFTDPELDFTVVAVKSISVKGERSLEEFGWLPLYKTPDRHIKTERVNIIQHPNGEKKQLALRENEIIDRDDDFLRYQTDTTPGSSGSPVFNDAWEVVALHHSGVPKRDANRRVLKRDGSVYQNGEDESLIDWIANEGARASRIVTTLEQASFTGQAEVLIQSVIAATSPPTEETTVNKSSKSHIIPTYPGTTIVTPTEQPGMITWTIPLEVSVRVGTPLMHAPSVQVSKSTDQVSTPPSPTIIEPTDSLELQEALRTLERSRTRTYYDAAQDATDRAAYYQGMDANQSKAALYSALQALLERSHTQKPRYKPMVELYPWIDLRPNGKIQSIYSAVEFDAVEFIRNEFHTEALRLAREAQLRERNALEASFDLLEASLPFNCEHVVPQSWYTKREPMRGDLHHLFACESGCNSFRSNTPFEDFTDFGEAIRGACGKSQGKGFEPESNAGKGAVARATLYFILRYPGEVNANAKEYTQDKIPTLLNWHNANPVSEYERHRNQGIFARQGNRNPLIDFPEWASKIEFKKGLGAA